jgi:hypothetical protein
LSIDYLYLFKNTDRSAFEMAEKDVRYLLTVIKNSEFTPRWPDIAQDFEINTASNAYDTFAIRDS